MQPGCASPRSPACRTSTSAAACCRAGPSSTRARACAPTTGASPYSTTALDRSALHAWVMVRPGKVVAVSNVHLSSGSGEDATRLAEAEPLAALGRLGADGTPVFLTGDFNSSSLLTCRHPAPRPRRRRGPARPGGHATSGGRRPARQLPRGATRTPARTRATPGRLARRIRWWTTKRRHSRIDYVFTAGSQRDARVPGRRRGRRSGHRHRVFPWPSDHRAVVSTFRVVAGRRAGADRSDAAHRAGRRQRVRAHLGSVGPALDRARRPSRRHVRRMR